MRRELVLEDREKAAVEPTPTFTSFAGQRLLASGDVKLMLLRTKEYLDGGGRESILIFNDQTGGQTEFDRPAKPARPTRIPMPAKE